MSSLDMPPTPEGTPGYATPGEPPAPTAPAAPTAHLLPPAATSAPLAPTEGSRGPRAGTVVFGVVAVAVAVLLVSSATGLAVDLQLTTIIGLGAAGFALLLAAVVGALRHRSR